MAVKKTAKSKIGGRLNIKGDSFDYQFLVVVYILLLFGLIMVLSASSPSAYSHYNDSMFYFKRQFMWAVIVTVGMIFFMNFDYRRLGKLAVWFLGISILLLILVVIPGVGVERNNAVRWLGYGAFQFQPSELAKLAVVLFFAYSLSKNYDVLSSFWKGLLPYLAIYGLVALLLMMEPHFSCTMLIGITVVIMLYIAGAKVSHFGILSIPAVVGIAAMIIQAPYRLKRVVSFLDPFADIQGDGWQIVQSLYAIGSGSLFGVGLGKSRQKYLYIPEPQNDFIFSIVAEELGLLGVMLVICLFAFLIIRGIRIAAKAPDLFGTLLAAGITCLIAAQALINIAVVTSSMPVTGMPLPFFSYGGTALAITMAEMGIILNISKQSKAY